MKPHLTGLRNLRVVFLGMDSLFTRASLQAVARRCRLVGIVEALQPKAADTDNSHLRSFAERRGLPHFLLKREGPRAVEFLQTLRPDIMCVASFSQVIRPEEFQIPPLGTINLHPSALPKYRGPNPYFWQHHEMDLNGAVTVHVVDDGVDTGDILLQDRFSIPLGASFSEVFQRSLQAGPPLMIRALALLAGGEAIRHPQRHLPCPVYARYVQPSERLAQWDAWPIERVWHFLRGTHDDWPFLPLPQGLAGRWAIGPMQQESCAQSPGSIVQDGDGYYVAHRQGKIRLRLIPPPSRATASLLRQARCLKRAIEWW